MKALIIEEVYYIQAKEKSHSRLLFSNVQGITEIIYKCIKVNNFYPLLNRTFIILNNIVCGFIIKQLFSFLIIHDI